MKTIYCYNHDEFEQHFVTARKAEPGVSVLFGGTPVGIAFHVSPYIIKVIFDSERIAQNIISAVEQLSILREHQRQDFLNKKDEVFNV